MENSKYEARNLRNKFEIQNSKVETLLGCEPGEFEISDLRFGACLEFRYSDLGFEV